MSNVLHEIVAHKRIEIAEAKQRCLYPNGITSLSPGLPRIAATLGKRHRPVSYPNGVASSRPCDATPLG